MATERLDLDMRRLVSDIAFLMSTHGMGRFTEEKADRFAEAAMRAAAGIDPHMKVTRSHGGTGEAEILHFAR